MCCRWVCLSLLFAGCGSQELELPTGDVQFEVKHYDYQLDLETRAASSILTIDVTGEGDCLRIPFRARGLADVTLDGLPITSGNLQDDVLTACGDGWESGSQIVLETSSIVREEVVEGTQVGFSVTEDLDGNDFTYLVSWVGGCDRFGPCDSEPARFARYRFEVTHAPGVTVLCPGTLEPGERVSVCDFDYAGAPTYSTFGIAASASWQPYDMGDWGGVQVTLYDGQESGMIDRFNAERSAEFLQWMVDKFGPYPYGDELRFFTGPTTWNGFEHPGNIALRDHLGVTLSAYAIAVEHSTFHEIVHQWAGNQTTLATTYDFVWKEAMAEYLSFVFEDETDNPGVAGATKRYWKRVARLAEYYPVPGEEPELVDYYLWVYTPGPMVLFRQIEAMFGRDAVLEALQSLLGEPRAIGIGDVQDALEAATGADLTNYFDVWVFGTGAPVWPTVDVTVTDNGDGTVTVVAAQVVSGDRYFGTAFGIRLTGDGDESHDVWIDFGVDGAATASADATPGFAVTGWDVDPDGHSLIVETTAVAAMVQQALGEPHPWLAE